MINLFDFLNTSKKNTNEVVIPKRPDWTNYFMGLAFVISQRSLDAQTKHGCIITDNHNHIIATGYNSFPRGMQDDMLPTTRPDKYDWMQHSEKNCISNCTANLWSISGATAYITGQPCNDCATLLWQNNVSRWFIAKRQGTMLENERTKNNFDLFIKQTGIEINYVDINLDWIKAIQV